MAVGVGGVDWKICLVESIAGLVNMWIGAQFLVKTMYSGKASVVFVHVVEGDGISVNIGDGCWIGPYQDIWHVMFCGGVH